MSLRRIHEIVSIDINNNNECLMNLMTQTHELYSSAGEKTTECVADVHKYAISRISAYAEFLNSWQTETLNLVSPMLDRIIEKNPVNDAQELAREILPGLFFNTQGSLRGRFNMQGNDFYSEITKSLGRLSFDLERCLKRVEMELENSIRDMRKDCSMSVSS